MNTGLLLEMAAEALSNRPAVGPASDPLSYAELNARARAAAAILQQSGAERVAYLGLNGTALPIALFASGIAGLPFAPLNYRLPDGDLRRLLARTAQSVLIVDDDMLARVQGVTGVQTLPVSQFLESSRTGQTSSPPAPDPDIAVLLFTSGTTGEPKAAVLRHRHLASYVISTVDFAGADEGAAALVSVPPYHIAGVSAVLTGVYGGRRLVYLPTFTPEDWVETAHAERITHAMVVPTMLGRILDVIESKEIALPDLQLLSYGGGRMPLSVIKRALRLLPRTDFVNAYGLTETSSTISILGPEDHRRARDGSDELAQRRLTSVGRPLPGLEVDIRGTDGQQVLAPGQVGEVYVRGEQIAGEYLDRSPVGSDGWFPTRDGGWLDEDGYLYLEGRLDDVIVRGGENISPGEIEDVLRTHPNVSDVAVLGAPDDRWGERIVAVIAPRGVPDAEDLKTWVKGRLRSTKAPEEIVFRAELPYNETGKLLRRLLRQELGYTA